MTLSPGVAVDDFLIGLALRESDRLGGQHRVVCALTSSAHLTGRNSSFEGRRERFAHTRMWNVRRTLPPPGPYDSSTTAVTRPRTRPV